MSFALRAFVLLSWLCAQEQALAQALPSSLVASQLKTSPEQKHRLFKPKKHFFSFYLETYF